MDRLARLHSVVARSGGIAPRATLVAAGYSPRTLASAVLAGRLLKVRRAWYATPDCEPDRMTAVALGGRLGAHSAAASYGLWRGLDDHLHVSWSPHGNIAKPGRQSTGFPEARTVVSHWREDRFADGPDPWRESIQQTLSQVIASAPEIELISVCDSAVNHGLVGVFELNEIFGTAPARVRSLVREVDGSADSGLETRVRVWARRRGYRVRTHVRLGGHPVDLLIDDSLVVEPGGRDYHSDDRSFEKDHHESGLLQLHGFTVYRPTYRMTMFDWPEVEATLLALMAQGRSRDTVTWF